MVSESTPLLSRTVPSPFLWRSGAILVATGMIVDAFGTHTLRRRPGITVDNLNAWRTAANYAIINGLGLLLVSMHPRFSTHRFAGYAILGGSAVFSGSIMALVLWKNVKFLGPITPLGGMMMIAGYAALAF
ncbi:hypothetical protein F5J12DRAFT_835917 [Pisolithus orientalis]|uniref:uncharacterized protein n=1 Tax=Pisolithus orientalis TaxID=936130 RepID=UPI002225252B|nr:uncharacterized protein F5J12DRAFT_835917 [Pisolithus orientalis]KAI6005281.1 hypothetical protein F5J12DRAFT_835917 [Pisolithus orientalis]